MDQDYLLEKWLNDTLTSEELEVFKKRDDYQFHADIIDAAQKFKASNFSNAADFNTFKQGYNKESNPVRKLNWTHTFIRIASVLVIAFGVYFTFFFNNITQVETQIAQKTNVLLPDDSEVTLNALSQIKYSKRKWAKNRSLNLDGEAYFKVSKGSQFDVKTSDGIVSVVGTEFSVKQRERYFEVKCYEGKVKVTSKSNEELLTQGQTFTILNGIFKLAQTNAKEPEWLKHMSTFSTIPFIEVINELERQYNIEIQLINVDTNRLFTGGFVHDNLENALNAITQPMNLTFEKESINHVVIHGSKE